MSSQRQDAFPFSQLVLRTVTAGEVGSKRFSLPYVPNLQGKTIIGIEAFSVTATPITPDGLAVITAARFVDCYLTLVDTKKVERMRQQPMATLLRANNNGNYISLESFEVDTQKSYIDYGDTGNNIAANDTFMFTFYYRDNA